MRLTRFSSPTKVQFWLISSSGRMPSDAAPLVSDHRPFSTINDSMKLLYAKLVADADDRPQLKVLSAISRTRLESSTRHKRILWRSGPRHLT